jgi:hypothetical protein
MVGRMWKRTAVYLMVARKQRETSEEEFWDSI